MIRHAVKFLRKAVGRVSREVMGTVTHVEANDRVAALTFDDGPHPEATPRLLDILGRYRAYGTFFVLGDAASKHPEILERMAKGGHAIGNHSWDHPSFPLIGSRERRRQILACAKLIAPYGKERLFRPPYGEQSFASRLDTLWLGHKVIMFNCEVGDWYEADAHAMADALCMQVEPGSIIAMHDALRWHATGHLVPKLTAQPLVDRGPMLRAVEMFLERMQGRYHFVTVPTLLRCGRPQRQNWYRTTPPEPTAAMYST